MYEIQTSKRRQKFTTRFSTDNADQARAWFAMITPDKGERVRLQEGGRTIARA